MSARLLLIRVAVKEFFDRMLGLVLLGLSLSLLEGFSEMRGTFSMLKKLRFRAPLEFVKSCYYLGIFRIGANFDR